MDTKQSNTPLKILIAEDERPIARVLADKLERLGFSIIVAYDGMEALTEVQEKKFDLIIADLMMPNLDGFQLLELLSAQEISTPVIISSNLNQESDIVKAKALGAADFVVKSNVTIKEIIKRIQVVLTTAGRQP